MKKFIAISKMSFLIFWSFGTIIGSMLLTYITFDRSIAINCGRKIWAPVILKLFGVELKIHGANKINSNQVYILVANHSSYMDIPVLFHSIPFNLYFVAKKELGKVPFLGYYLRRVEMILIDRGNSAAAQESMQLAGKSIREGKSVVVFPEGTSKGGGEIGEFKKGGFHLAQAARVPILPIRIKGTENIWPSHDNLNIGSGKVEVFIGDPITSIIETKEDINKACQELRETLIQLGQ